MEKETPEFTYGIIRILDCGFGIQELISPELDKITVGYGMNFGINTEENWVQYVIKADFMDSETNSVFLSGTSLTRFNVTNLKGFIKENNDMLLPDGFLETLFGIAFTHMRAILAKNIAGSKFSNIIVPIVNPNPLFKDLLQIQREEMKKRSQGKTSNPHTDESIEELITASVGGKEVKKEKKPK